MSGRPSSRRPSPSPPGRGGATRGPEPAQTGDDGTITGDAEFVAALIGLDEPPDAICPYRLQAPLAPSVAASLEGRRLDPRSLQLIQRPGRAARSRAGRGRRRRAGALLDGVDMAGLASLLGLPVVVAARPGLGTLNHTLLTLEALHRRGLTVLGVVISGYPAEPGLDALTNPPALARSRRSRCWGHPPRPGHRRRGGPARDASPRSARPGSTHCSAGPSRRRGSGATARPGSPRSRPILRRGAPPRGPH